MTATLPIVLPPTSPTVLAIHDSVALISGREVRPPAGYAFIIQNKKIVMQAGKLVVRKVT